MRVFGDGPISRPPISMMAVCSRSPRIAFCTNSPIAPSSSEMKPAGPNEWKGEIYNAENGKTYDGKMSVAGPDALKISGCVFGGLFCGGQTWERFKEEGTASVALDKPAAPPLASKPAPAAGKTDGAANKPVAGGTANKTAVKPGGKNGSVARVEGEVCPDQPG